VGWVEQASMKLGGSGFDSCSRHAVDFKNGTCPVFVLGVCKWIQRKA